MLRDFPSRGIGLDQFLWLNRSRYIDPHIWNERYTSHPHNLLLDSWLSLGLPGLALLAVGFYTAYRPTIYAASSFWTSSPTYFAIRMGAMLMLLSALYAVRPWLQQLPRLTRVLEAFGRNSLFIYWIHVEIVYGYTTWILRQRLPLWSYPVAYIVFCSLMLGAISCKDRVLKGWRLDRTSRSTPTAVPV